MGWNACTGCERGVGAGVWDGLSVVVVSVDQEQNYYPIATFDNILRDAHLFYLAVDKSWTRYNIYKNKNT